MVLNEQIVDVLTALVILGAAAALVMVAIVIGQHLDQREVRAAAAAASAETERLANRADRHEADALPTEATKAGPECSPFAASPSLLVTDDTFHPAPAQPWRPVAQRDLTGVATHRHTVSHLWFEPESDGLVELYRVGFLLDELAAELDIEPCSIVEELARRVFGAIDPVADPLARRFGQPWTAAELRTLHSAERAGLSVPEIARQLGRDQLSVVFRLLEAAAEARTAEARTTEASVEGAREAALLA